MTETLRLERECDLSGITELSYLESEPESETRPLRVQSWSKHGEPIICCVLPLDTSARGSVRKHLYDSFTSLFSVDCHCHRPLWGPHQFIPSYVSLPGLPRPRPTNRAAQTTEIYPRTALKAGSPKSRRWQGWFLLRAVRDRSFLDPWLETAVFSLCLFTSSCLYAHLCLQLPSFPLLLRTRPNDLSLTWLPL